MKKYLFVATNEWFNWGGSELLWSSTAKELARQGNDVRASVPGFVKDFVQVEELRSAGCDVMFRANFPPFAYRCGRRVLPFLPEYNLRHLRSASRGVDLVVISQGSYQDGIWWLEAVKSEGLKYALIIQTASELWWPDDVMAERLATAYEQAACIYCVSQDTLSLFRLQLASLLSRGKIIRNPFNVPYDVCPAWPEYGAHELSLACVARLDGATKGHDLLLRVLALPHWRKRSVRVSLIGKGMNERVLRMMATQLKLDNVEFAGHQRDIEGVWRTHHALVLPSRFEGMPLVVVEAMLCGRPCIATDVGGSRELIRDGINGFLARAATVEMLDEAMNRAWDNRSRLREIGAQAAIDVRQFVSRDPAEIFARELGSLANGQASQ